MNTGQDFSNAFKKFFDNYGEDPDLAPELRYPATPMLERSLFQYMLLCLGPSLADKLLPVIDHISFEPDGTEDGIGHGHIIIIRKASPGFEKEISDIVKSFGMEVSQSAWTDCRQGITLAYLFDDIFWKVAYVFKFQVCFYKHLSRMEQFRFLSMNGLAATPYFTLWNQVHDKFLPVLQLLEGPPSISREKTVVGMPQIKDSPLEQPMSNNPFRYAVGAETDDELEHDDSMIEDNVEHDDDSINGLASDLDNSSKATLVKPSRPKTRKHKVSCKSSLQTTAKSANGTKRPRSL